MPLGILAQVTLRNINHKVGQSQTWIMNIVDF